MRLYLSSYKLGNMAKELVPMVGQNKKAAVIINAIDFSNDRERAEQSNKEQLESLDSLGFIAEELDLRRYFNKSDELAVIMKEYGLVWVRGGNTFILRKAMKYSGFDKIIKKMLENDEIVYGGYSAGVCVLSPSLKGLELVDDPNAVSEGYTNEVIWEGLGILEYYFAPHYRSDHPESEATDKVVQYYVDNKMLFKALRDGEVIVIK